MIPRISQMYCWKGKEPQVLCAFMCWFSSSMDGEMLHLASRVAGFFPLMSLFPILSLPLFPDSSLPL